MPQIRSPLQMPQMRIQRTIKGDMNMGCVLVTYKVFPEDIVANFDNLKAKIKAILPEFAVQLKDRAKNQSHSDS